jgi:GTP-binding protein
MVRPSVETEFIMSAVHPGAFPRLDLPEIAFLGRSNVGKSSLLNSLTKSKRLAFTSSKPGCTQAINFYRIADEFGFADLPGYGYARVSRETSGSWKQLIESYLLERQELRLSLLLLDARRGWMDRDLELKEWLEYHRRPAVVVATKFDKLKNQKEQHQCLTGIRKLLPDGELVAFSAITGQGVREIWQAIWKTRNP